MLIILQSAEILGVASFILIFLCEVNISVVFWTVGVTQQVISRHHLEHFSLFSDIL